jgi:hypothetical protein
VGFPGFQTHYNFACSFYPIFSVRLVLWLQASASYVLELYGIVEFCHRYSFQLEKEAAAIENACETVLRSLGHFWQDDFHAEIDIVWQ